MNLRRFAAILAILALGFLLGFGASSLAREPHPAIHKAQKQLMNARNTLEHAAHDFGGHRVKAIQHIDAALDELQQALNFDRE